METRVRKKAVILTALSLVTLGSLAVLPHVVQAAGNGTTTKDLVIHKIENGDDTIHENNGNTRPSSLIGDYLPGAGFTIVDVSEKYYTYAISPAGIGKTPAQIYSDYFNLIKHESNAEIKARGTIVGTEKVDAATGKNADGIADGQVTFADLPTKTSSGKDAIYAVVETTRPKNTVTTIGAGEVGSNVIGTIPTLVAMPLNGTEPIINIYPKNEVGQLTKDFTNSNDAHVSLAQHISYDISLKLPRDLGERIAATGNLKYKSFTVNEMPGLGLIFGGYDEPTTLVNDGTKTQSLNDFLSQYDLTAVANPTTSLVGDGGSKASLTISPMTPSGDTTKWAELASKTLTFTVACWLDEAYFEAHPENILMDIKNKANYKVTEDNGFEVVPDEGEVKSITAKYKFQKNDANTGYPLTGATFSVGDGVTGNLRFKEIGTSGSGVYMVTASATGVDILSVGSDGTLTLLGLDPDLVYGLTEVTAPAGYRLLEPSIAFQPNQSDIYDSGTDLAVNGNKTDANHNIYNTPNNFLPSTGGRGFAIFGLVAVAGLGGAGVLYYLKRKNAQEAA
ncbi:SpaH/EbpB family LPXTG-anchored major pilin [Pseudolactococcus reticulitermitis]|uniref:Gram-positive cocci surface proteins LPxTG domain-containing protein n=1 Tax=Pseudolactococcus reticulitermitis TaxID=2025039 RepID=A0A224WXN0_9LACT|nr:SpaH/EbpB family LPXTG-anchored major pilin [Lactococcus reticulitermitis]GAX46937.1 hypothetical protein RsY01_517 [Lactococcus reticulitermitis]